MRDVVIDTLFDAVRCLQCGCQIQADLFPGKCPDCGSPWLDAVYAYNQLPGDWTHQLASRPTSMWRYTELLPFASEMMPVSMSEGWTPLLSAKSLERKYGNGNLWIKDERREPTGSFKDRQASGTVSALKARGVDNLVLASTGNAAAAYAAYCARAGIKLWLFIPDSALSEKTRELALYGAEIIKVAGTYDQAKQIASDFAARRGFLFDQGAKAIPGKECFKTIAFEIAEQLNWKAPDWYIQAVSGGIGPLGVLKGFRELFQLGIIDRIPKLGIVQVNGCAPMVHAYEQGLEHATPVEPETLITVLSTGDPGFSYELLRAALNDSGGTMLSVSDGEAFRAMRWMAREEGCSMEPASSVAFAGLDKMMSMGQILPHETVVINCSGHTFSAEKHTLEDRYALFLAPTQPVEQPGESGSRSVLDHLDEQVTTIVIIDDNPNDSRLLRRFLQHYKRYRILEAHSGLDGIDLVLQHRPDLVVLDLTLPNMDGFDILGKLKSDSRSRNIPVIVVSAKALSQNEWETLKSQTISVWEKGSFRPQELVEHVVKLLNDCTASGNIDSLIPASSPTETMLAGHFGIEQQKRVLVIDPNKRNARLLRQLLESRQKFDVLEMNQFCEAITELEEHAPDLLLFALESYGPEEESQIQKLKAVLKQSPIILLLAEGVRSRLPLELSKLVDSTWEKETLDRNTLLSHVETLLMEHS